MARLTGRGAIEALKEAQFKLAFMKDQLQKVVDLAGKETLIGVKLIRIMREL